LPELWLFEVAIGSNANFQILGAKAGKFQFSLTKPYKESECHHHQNASFKPLTAIIDLMSEPVEMRMKLNNKAQLSLTNPRDVKVCQKLLQFDVLTTLSMTILDYLHSFSCCGVRSLRNPAKFSENSNS